MISGFISASGLLIAASQLKTLMGVKAEGHSLLALLQSLSQQVQHTHVLTLIVGALATGFLFWVRRGLKPLLMAWGLGAKPADMAVSIVSWSIVMVDRFSGTRPST